MTSTAGDSQSEEEPKVEKNLLDQSESGELGNGLALPPDNNESTGSPDLPTATVVQLPPSNGEANPSKNEARIQDLENKLAEAEAMVETLSKEKETKTADNDEASAAIMMELQGKLQSEMALKAETENKLRLAQKQIEDLQTHGQEQTAEFEKYRGLQHELTQTTRSKDEAESNLQTALDRIQTLEKEQLEQQKQLEKLQSEVVSSREALANQEQELEKIREQRDEQERKEMSLTNRLNAAKKKEAGKTNEAEKYEEELKTTLAELERSKYQVEELSRTKTKLQKELEETIVSSRHRQVQTEAELADERKLNDDRKQKMKVFIEKKSEEIRQVKADNDSLQSELNQTSRSLSELNIRWKQLHAQWVQSQTRNRELQRDLHRIKKDSENLHKVGDTLEMKLSRSANETEEHKNKRLAAKNELMTVLSTLESEREVSSRLRDSIKFTFTPKALSQQQLLNESLEDFETQLVKLSIRLRKPLPPLSSDQDGGTNNDNSTNDDWMDATMDNDSSDELAANRQDFDTSRLIEKLNRETQQVSKCIMSIVSGIERLHLLLDVSGNRTCYTVLNEIIGSTGGFTAVTTGERREETAAMTGSPQLHSITSRDYHH